MTNLNNGTTATDLDSHHNLALTAQGYTIRHIETYHDTKQSFIIWDQPALTPDDLPF